MLTIRIVPSASMRTEKTSPPPKCNRRICNFSSIVIVLSRTIGTFSLNAVETYTDITYARASKILYVDAILITSETNISEEFWISHRRKPQVKGFNVSK